MPWLGWPDHLVQVGVTRLARSTALGLDHRPSIGLSSGAHGRRRLTTSQDRYMASRRAWRLQPRQALLQQRRLSPRRGNYALTQDLDELTVS
jgi:hypothetical protein